MNDHLPSSIIFDLDGTLVDSLPGIEHSVRASFFACRVPLLDNNFRKMIGPPIRTILSRAGNIEEPQLLSQLEDSFRASYDTEGWRKTRCFPAVVPVLQLMRHQRHRLFVVSNKPRHISEKILRALGIYDHFEEILTRDSVTPPYPGKEEMIRALLKTHKIAPEACVMTGDTMEDAQAAKAVGMRFAYMADGYGDVVADASVSIDYYLDGFRLFMPLLARELA